MYKSPKCPKIPPLAAQRIQEHVDTRKTINWTAQMQAGCVEARHGYTTERVSCQTLITRWVLFVERRSGEIA
jgi:hypothetical protein